MDLNGPFQLKDSAGLGGLKVAPLQGHSRGRKRPLACRKGPVRYFYSNTCIILPKYPPSIAIKHSTLSIGQEIKQN